MNVFNADVVAEEVSKQRVSVPKGLSPAAFCVPDGHGTHALDETYSFTAHNSDAPGGAAERGGVHVVSAPEGSSPAALVVPAGHATHALETTCWFDAHKVASQVVSAPDASSPAAFVVPVGRAVQVPLFAVAT